MSKKDKMLLCPLQNNENGSVETLRVDNSGVYIGNLTPVKDGQPIPPNSQIIDTREVPGYSPWRSGELVYSSSAPALPSHSGPPKVNSEPFRAGWDAIWGSKGIN